jgi:exodeoxyribonuclease VII small subunit
MDFEKNLQRLETIVQLMEKGDLPLDESLKLFEEGVRLSRACQADLAKAEAQVQKLLGVDSNGNPILTPFNSADEEKTE